MQTKECVNYITDWLLSYSKQSKTRGFVVGVSGGIDSAVTSTLAAKTGLEVLCLEMPIHQEINQINRANEHINWLKESFNEVSSLRVDLGETYDYFKQTVGNDNQGESHQMALVNSRARLRMTTLYYHAQLKNYLVVGTGNKVEDFGIGFYTKYGDGGVDISPIADLMKSEVRELSEVLNIDSRIINAEPTDGLWDDDRTDEKQLGLSYDELEEAMTNSNSINREKYKKIRGVNTHKMNPIPVCKLPR